MAVPPCRAVPAACAVLAVLALAACTADAAGQDAPDVASATQDVGYPVSVENCGRTITFDAAPKRVVSLWQAPTEMMLALGLEDRVIAMAGNYADYPEDVAQAAADIPEIGTSMSWPSKEVLLSEAPDLVVGQSLEGFAFDTSAGYASVEQIEDIGANVYGANMCETADSLDMSIDTTADTLRDLGTIFGVSERAEAIIADLEAQKQAVVDAVVGEEDVDVAFFNGGDGPLIVLAGGIYDSAISTAGGTNVFPESSVYVSKEEFAAADPDVILVGTYEGQEFTALRDYLTSTFPDMRAVREGRLEEIPVNDTDASVGVMTGLAEIAEAIHPDVDVPAAAR